MFLLVVSAMASVHNGILRVACNSECPDQQQLLHLEKISVTAGTPTIVLHTARDNFAHDPQIRNGHAHIRHRLTDNKNLNVLNIDVNLN